MLDKIVILSCRKQAYLIFDDRVPFTVSSDVDVIPLLMFLLGRPNAKLKLSNDGQTVCGIELRRDCSDEITVKIFTGDAA